jgi:hypothetical protein
MRTSLTWPARTLALNSLYAICLAPCPREQVVDRDQRQERDDQVAHGEAGLAVVERPSGAAGDTPVGALAAVLGSLVSVCHDRRRGARSDHRPAPGKTPARAPGGGPDPCSVLARHAERDRRARAPRAPGAPPQARRTPTEHVPTVPTPTLEGPCRVASCWRPASPSSSAPASPPLSPPGTAFAPARSRPAAHVGAGTLILGRRPGARGEPAGRALGARVQRAGGPALRQRLSPGGAARGQDVHREPQRAGVRGRQPPCSTPAP